MESATPPSLINAPRGPDSVKWDVCKQSACCHCSQPSGTGVRRQQCSLGPSLNVFTVLCFLHLSCPVAHSPLPVHPSVIHPICDLCYLRRRQSSTLPPSFQGRLSEQPVRILIWGLIHWGHEPSVSEGNLWGCQSFSGTQGCFWLIPEFLEGSPDTGAAPSGNCGK